jgi:hypothetical protein
MEMHFRGWQFSVTAQKVIIYTVNGEDQQSHSEDIIPSL